ncbi:MAG: hypothetical protein LUQ11_11165, partial [Methylococcaceae bacterium]|nr:hypothetical protein [Methylococcaceae bacterium]
VTSLNTKAKEVAAKAAPFIFIAGLLISVSMALHLLIAINSDSAFEISRSSLLGTPNPTSQQLALRMDANSETNNVHLDISAQQAMTATPSLSYSEHWHLLSNARLTIVVLVFSACLLCLWLLDWRIDINEFSLNRFYRNRLTRCYLGATRPKTQRNPNLFTGFDDGDDIELAKLLSDDQTPSGPLHIVNCALNLGGSTDLTLHTRHSNSFTLTPLACGSHYEIKKPNGSAEKPIGYVDTRVFGGETHQPTLGQAISVSGAAASPNMGYHTSAPVAFLMTLFNARLGWWFPNPSESDCQRPSPTSSLQYLLRELFGFANEKSSFLAISDGGHFENLAAYELVKRRCQVIIISDGECDPKLRFEGLATLIRMCEVDLGASIKIDVNAIHPENENGWSRGRCAIGTISYQDQPQNPGWLIYLKASMNGQEDTTIMQYKAAHPDFPHETTGDQFYAEDQFESYRGLGMDVAEKLFGKIKTVGSKSIASIADELNTIFSPTLPYQAQFTHHADRLMEIWHQICTIDALGPLDLELRPSTGPTDPDRSVFYLCSEMIQLMENVYLDMNLEDTWEHEDNKGWMELFKQWANSPKLRATWNQTRSTYGVRFQSFWARNL